MPSRWAGLVVPMRASRRSLLAALIGAAATLGGCGSGYEVGHSELGIAQTEDGDPVYPSTYSRCKNVTVSGDVFYNDLRQSGRFSTRKSPAGSNGTRDSFGGDNMNYLGLRDATVEIYEIDRNSVVSGGCLASQLQGSTKVNSDGSFAWSGEICDNCEVDYEGGVNDTSFSVAAKIVLRQCDNDRCFRVATPSSAASTGHFNDDYYGSTRSRWFRTATTTAPKVFSGLATDIGVDYYQASGSMTSGVPSDMDAQAANVFASMVDVTRKVHTELDVPFDEPEVTAYFPEPAGTHSHEGGFLCVKSPGAGAWLAGDEPAHEYGHLLHYPEWNHHGKWVSYCYDSDGDGDDTDDCEESYAQKEYVNAAFKEGWADFIAHVTFDQTGSTFGCDRIEFDAPRGCTAGQTCPTGRHYFSVVSQVLCDLWDTGTTVDTEEIDGVTLLERSELSLPTLVAGLRSMWLDATEDQRDEYERTSVNRDTTVALGICEFAESLVSSQVSSHGLDTTLNVSNLECANL